MEPARIVPCPTCQAATKWSRDNPNRPFCSERCKLIDLGEWASEGHKIPGDAEHQDINSEDLQ